MSARVIDASSPSWSTNGATNWNGGGHNVSHDFGFGLVDAHAAVRLAETWTTQRTADNELVIAVSGDVGADGALTDFVPRSYFVTVRFAIRGLLDRLGRTGCFVPARPRRRPAHPI